VADIILTSSREIYINGLAPGVTNLSLWGGSRFSSARVTVEADVSLLKEKLAQVLPKEKIAVQAADDSVVLSGEVSGPGAQETALALALPFTANKKDRIINLTHVGGVQQVLLEVRVAEISRQVARHLGINFSGVDRAGNAFGLTALSSLAPFAALSRGAAGSVAETTTGVTSAVGAGTQFIQAATNQSVNMMSSFRTGNYIWTLFLDYLKENRLGRVLAEPNLVTTSGQEASFLAGGEFPVPVPQQFQSITIEFKKFGVGLVFTPTVLDEGRIAMRVNPEVSELDFTIGTTLTVGGSPVPGLRVRRLSSHIELNDGQTFAVAGLLSDEHRGVVGKFPVLGDLPVLGPLFRSTQYQKQETELVVLATPHLVKPMPAGTAKLPTDKFVEPSDLEFYLTGALQGKEAPKNPAPANQGSLPAEFGRQPVK
jgi:pilus assembly protein CpaC